MDYVYIPSLQLNIDPSHRPATGSEDTPLSSCRKTLMVELKTRLLKGWYVYYNVLYNMVFVCLRANTSICPRLSAVIFVCAENVIKMWVFCIMANFMLYIGTYSIGTCASLLHIIIIIIIITIIIIIIKPLLKIFNECRSLTGVGELNPYWRSSMNV